MQTDYDETDLQSLVTNRVNHTHIDECPVCYQSYDTPTIRIILACNHTFCMSCITRWSYTDDVCPMCRKIFELPSHLNPNARSRIKKLSSRIRQLELELEASTNVIENYEEIIHDMERHVLHQTQLRMRT